MLDMKLLNEFIKAPRDTEKPPGEILSKALKVISLMTDDKTFYKQNSRKTKEL